MQKPTPQLPITADDIVDTVREPILILSSDLRVRRANRSFYMNFKVTPENTEGKLVYELGNKQWDIPGLRRLLEEIIPQNLFFDDFEVIHNFESVGRKVMLLNARRVLRESNHSESILLAFEDITERRRLENERAELETRFTSLVKNIKDHSIFTLDIQGNITSWNREAENILGYTEDEALGQHFKIIFTLEDQLQNIPALELRTALTEGRAEDVRWHKRKGGELFWAFGIVTPTHDASGQHTGYSKILRDMTDAKRAEEELRLQAELIDKVGEAVIVTDVSGKITHWNAFAERLYGWPKAEALGRDIMEVVIAEEGMKYAQDIMEQLRKGDSWSGEFSVRRRDGTVFPAYVTDTPIMNADHEIVGIIGVSSDFTERKQVESAFIESEQRYRGLMEQSPYSIQVFSPDGYTIRVNHAWERLWGLKLDQIAEYNILEDRQLEEKGILHLIRKAFSGESVHVPAVQYDPNVTIPNHTQHGEPTRWVSSVIYPLKDTAGRIREVVVVHDDITARKRAEEALYAAHRQLEAKVAARTSELSQTNRFLQALLENVQDGIVACNSEGVLTLFNSVTRQMHGLPEEPIPAGEWSQHYRLFRADGETPMTMEEVPLYRAFQGERVRGVEMVIVPQDLPPRTVLASGQAFFDSDGAKLGAVVSMHDITQRKLTEIALLEAHAELERRVEDRTLELAHANQALRDADRRKDEFLATLAHELRNPLAPIRNSLEILKMSRIDAAAVQQTRDMMERQVHHLVRLVDDLLDVSRVMRGKIELRREPVGLATIVARAVETVQPLIDIQGHQLHLSLPHESLLLDADAVRLAQVVGNLLTNAAKYTDARGNIWLTADEVNGQAVLKVRDSGIGVATEMLPQIFELFVQVDQASTRSQGGLGIGLTLVKNLVQMHGGSVEAHSDGLGKGCEFTVRLPIAKPLQPQASPETANDDAQLSPASRLRLLVVDDNKDAAVSLAMLLRLQRYEVRVAHSGPTALELAATYLPDVVFLDIGMPGMDGYEVARLIRQQRGLENVVIAALTGWGQKEDRRRTSEAGFDHHLVKPPEPEALQHLLAKLERS